MDVRTSAFLASRDVDALLPPTEPWSPLYRAAWDIQRAALTEFVDALLGATVRPVIFKGAELISRYFPDTPLGFLVDADVLLERHQMQTAKRILYALGYTQSYFDRAAGTLVARDVGDLGRLEAAHYELGPFCKLVRLDVDRSARVAVSGRNAHPIYVVGEQCWVVVEIDVHHSVATDVDPAPLFARAVSSTCCRGLTLSATDHLWVNCSRFYNEVAHFGKRSLRPLVYSAPLLTQESIDWRLLVEVARELELSSSLYYPLLTLASLTGAEIPAPVLEVISPLRSARDFGWQLGALFGFVEPFPFHQQAQPLEP